VLLVAVLLVRLAVMRPTRNGPLTTRQETVAAAVAAPRQFLGPVVLLGLISLLVPARWVVLAAEWAAIHNMAMVALAVAEQHHR
jgi:hypothetical protein